MGLREWFLRGMEPTKGELQDRYTQMSDADLLAIVQDTVRYTQAAIGRARAELNRRRQAEPATFPAGGVSSREAPSPPKRGGQGSPRAPQKDASALLRAIMRHTSVVYGDKSQQGRLAQLASMGPEVIPQIEAAVWSVIQNPPESGSAFENAGLLCEAIGRTHGARSFEVLSRLATQPSQVAEYRFVREGAVRGLGHLHDQRASDVLAAVSAEFGLDSVVSDAYRALGLEMPRPPGPSSQTPDWVGDARTWDGIAEVFIRSQLAVQAPDFKGLSEALAPFDGKRRHGAWHAVALAFKRKGDRRTASQCFVEALLQDLNDTSSTAWRLIELPPEALGIHGGIADRLAAAANRLSGTPDLIRELRDALGAPGSGLSPEDGVSRGPTR